MKIQKEFKTALMLAGIKAYNFANELNISYGYLHMILKYMDGQKTSIKVTDSPKVLFVKEKVHAFIAKYAQTAEEV